MLDTKLLDHIHSSRLAPSEMVQASCTIAREQLEAGDYEAGCAALRPWWKVGEWPRQVDLSSRAAAELLLTAGTLNDYISRARQEAGGQRLAEALLNGAIALFEQIGDKGRSIESRIELGCCYYHQGLFDLAHSTLSACVLALSDGEHELKAVALIRLAIVERHSGRLHEALSVLTEAGPLAEAASAWTKGRFHTELANTLKDLGTAENQQTYFDKALNHYREALSHFKHLGNLRYAAAVENNRGYLLLTLKRFQEAQTYLQRARDLFDGFGDGVGSAQVDETLAQLYLASGHYELAERAVRLAVDRLETTGADALLAEALTTQGLVFCRLGKRYEAKPMLERAQRVAERCGDFEGAGRALLILIEELCERLGDDERREIGARAHQLLANSQQKSTRERLRLCMERIAAAHAEHERQRGIAAHAEKMAALGELSFGVAHNVNNALSGILGRAQLLRRTGDREKITEGLELIIKSAEDGAQIIRRIQDFARKQPSREFQAVSVAELLKDVCEMSRPRWESRVGRPIRLALFADCTALVMGDAVELREVLLNMIYNAVDAMPQGGEVRMSAQESDGQIVLSITDNGTGMSAEVKSRLFDPFFTTKGRAGTGMGLAVSFGIIRRHNGFIEVDSEQGRGTTFRITLPLAKPAQATKPSEPMLTIAEAAMADARVRVLVVDDEQAVREVLREALEAEGCEVFVAESGAEALKIYEERNGEFDLLLTDIGMPEMSGWELARAIRERSGAMPLGIISGWADAISSDERDAVNANWVVPKPFDIEKIAQIANEVSSRRRREQPPVVSHDFSKSDWQM